MNQKLPQINETALIEYLHRQPDIAAAYLFGSYAEGRAHPGSDVDVAVLFDEDVLSSDRSWSGPLVQRPAQMRDDLSRLLGQKVDVVALNRASPLFRNQVLRTGRLLHEGHREQRIEFEVRTGKIYADLKPMYDFFNQDLLDKIGKVGLRGRRRRARAATRAR